MTKSVSILGSTGVIGTLTLEVLEQLGSEYSVASLAAGSNVERLVSQIYKWRPKYVSVANEETRLSVLEQLRGTEWIPEMGVGDDGLLTMADVPCDIFVTAIVGAKGLVPTWRAIGRGAKIALANKETLVAAGDLVMPYAHQSGSAIIPVDSEHSALFQCLLAGNSNEVEQYILTASGGPFRTWSKEQMQHVSVEAALQHPNWTMGRKITIDSASMMNKGLEVIEAHHLFSAPYDKIKILVHPQSVVHSLIEFIDGSVVAQMGAPDMRVPIQYALTYPARTSNSWSTLNLLDVQNLSFEAPDLQRFPSLRLAFEAGKSGGYAPCILNAANEIAVEAFLSGRIKFSEMAKLVEIVLERCDMGKPTTIEDVIAMDKHARIQAQWMIEKGEWQA